MTTSKAELAGILLTVLKGVPGLRTATPSPAQTSAGLPWDLELLAVDVEDDLVEISLVALALPLPPLLRRAEHALRSALDDTEWAPARLRLIVTDLDAAAFTARGYPERFES
ncbi:hypothetical protein [Amycolatopsis sp. H20-H5]|uniref:hypothetical protein n=1 Tax=Amycolatopsis sp. H20-H5 TaxID=3046309 RepID=UPI002DB6FB2C|nr:hypothetical protein [Amycolatopsis sp. H20-H5]MEC3976165.1 hypothetical protein [Amycolatopsis sp. H20-H5]